MTGSQLDLFGSGSSLPAGFRYQADLISPEEEQNLLERFAGLPFREFEFHGYVGKRRTVSFGWEYDFSTEQVLPTEDMPDFLLPLREKAASFADLTASELPQALVTEYQAGAAIGWHKDKGVFGDVVGISLLAPCVFRLRRRKGTTWERASVRAEPCSAYLLRGSARMEWEHSILAVESLRYSVTFRTLRSAR
jgi:alkylated DNA repair dioxygenase AlkB